MATLFFAGLVLTCFASSWFHLDPQPARLIADRSGMAVAFAGLIGLVVAGRVGERASALFGLAVLFAAPWSIHAAATGNLLPWVIIQFGGMAIVAVLAFAKPLPGALDVQWFPVIAIYCVAKLLEAADAPIFELTGHLVSGHSLKHIAAAFAAWPVVSALGKLAVQGQNHRFPASLTRSVSR